MCLWGNSKEVVSYFIKILKIIARKKKEKATRVETVILFFWFFSLFYSYKIRQNLRNGKSVLAFHCSWHTKWNFTNSRDTTTQKLPSFHSWLKHIYNDRWKENHTHFRNVTWQKPGLTKKKSATPNKTLLCSMGRISEATLVKDQPSKMPHRIWCT